MELDKHETCREYFNRRLKEGWKCISLEGYNAVLSSPDGNILRPVDLRNDVETLRPNAPGDECSLYTSVAGCSGCPNTYDCVDEETADDDTTYFYHSQAGGNYTWLFNLPASSGSGTINKITLHFRMKATNPGDNVKGRIKSDTTFSESAAKNPYSDFGSNVWGPYTQEWAVNPADSEAWEWADIDALQIGLRLLDRYTFCTQIYVEVDYTPPIKHEKTLTESLGLVDKVVKAPALAKSEPLGLVDTYSRTWAIYRTYSELLGFVDKVVKAPSVVKTEPLGLVDSVIKDTTLHDLAESLGLADTVVKMTSIVKSEALGLIDSYSRVWSVYRTYSELLGLADSIQKYVNLHPLSETLGLADIITKHPSKILWEAPGYGVADWLAGWARRVKLTIDQNDIDDALANFPILVHLGTSVGRNGDDVSFVFDELESDANRKKIAVTKADGTTQCYVEIEKWDHANEQAWLWVKVPDIASDADTDLYLYYDKTQPDNDTYVGDPNSTPAENVWDDDFELVCHMRDDPDTSHVRDSSVNANDGTKKAANEPIEADGKVGKAQDFDGADDEIATLLLLSGYNKVTISGWFYRESTAHRMDIAESEANNQDRVKIIRNSNDVIYFVLQSGPTSSYGSIPNSAIGWLYLTLAYDGTLIGNSERLKGYIDGQLQSLTMAGTIPALLPTFTQVLKIGKDDGAGICSNGIIDEVRISAIARTAPWIKASYESGRDHLLDFGSEETGAGAGGLGLSDTVVKAPALMKTESLGLVDTLTKDMALHPLTEVLGLLDSVVKSPSITRSELLALEDRVSKHPSKALTEVLGLLDSISYTPNPTVLAKLIRKYLQLVDISGGGEE